MLNIIQNTIGALARKGLSVIRNGLKMWLPFEKSEILGEELVVNGDFATDSDWTSDDSSWAISGGKANATNSTGFHLQQAFTHSDKKYRVTYTISNYSSGNVLAYIGGTGVGTSISSNGTYTEIIQAAGSNNIFFRTTSSFSGSIDNISIKEVTQIAPDKSGVDKEILGVEEVENGDFSDGSTGWTDNSCTLSVVDNTLKVTSTAGFGNAEQNITVVSGKTYKVSADFIYGGSVEGRLNAYDGYASPIEVAASDDASLSFYITISTGQTNLRIRTVNQSATTNVYNNWDNISVKEVTQAFAEPNSAKLFTGKALSFDGVNDYVDLDGFTMSGSDATFSFWINPDATTQNIIDFNPNRFIVGFQSGTNQLSILSGGWANFGVISTNVWSRCVIVLSGTTAKCYVNGIQLGVDKTITAIDIGSSSEVKIGSAFNGTGNFFNGDLSDFQIYDTAWTQDDVTFDYNNPQHLVTDNSELRYGSELVDNGDFATDLSDWTNANNHWQWTSQGAYFPEITTHNPLSQILSNNANAILNLTFTLNIVKGTANVFYLDASSTTVSTQYTTSGTYTIYTTPVKGNTNINFSRYGGINTEFYIDNISVKEVTSPTLNNLKGYWHLSEGDGAINYDSSGEGNDGTINGATWEDQQATIPQLGLMDWSKGSNLIEYSEDFSEWTIDGSSSITSNATTSPIGTSNATKLIAGSVSGRQAIKLTSSNSGDLAFSVYAKKSDYSFIQFSDGQDASAYANFDLNTGVVGSSSVYTPTIINIGNGWYRCIATFDAALAINNVRIGLITSSTSARVENFSGDGTSGVYIWGAQLEEGSSVTAYRRTNGTTVTDATLIADPNNPSEDILGNDVRLREHSLNLDGSGYAEVPDADNLDFATDFTMECWIKKAFTSQGSTYNCALSSGGQIGTLGVAALYVSTDKIYFRVTSNFTTYLSDMDGEWAHVVGTRESGTMTLYVNGNAESTTTNSDAINTTDDITVGKDLNASRYYTNLIDDVRIYNRALSSDEVEQNYKAGLNKHKASSSFSDDFSSDYGF